MPSERHEPGLGAIVLVGGRSTRMGTAKALVGHEIAAPVADGRSHPLAAVYRIETLSRIEALLSGGQLRATALLEAACTHALDAGSLPHPESLRNLNTPQEYERAIAEPEP